MITSGSLLLDTNTVSCSSAITLSGESLITLYVFDSSGSHNTHEVVLEIRPDLASDWIKVPSSITGIGFRTELVAAIQARACVTIPEGSASESNIYMIAV